MLPIPVDFLDLLLVETLSALPLAYVIFRAIHYRLRVPVVALCVSFLFTGWAFWGEFVPSLEMIPGGLQLARAFLIAIPVAFCLTVLFKVFTSSAVTEGEPVKPGRLLASLAIAWAVFLTLSVTYQSQRVNATVAQLAQYESELRIGEFLATAESLARVSPRLVYKDYPMHEIAVAISEKVEGLQANAAMLPDGYEKAKSLAMLGDRSAAIELLLKTGTDRELTVPELLLLATMQEHEHNWPDALETYRIAEEKIDPEAPQSERMLEAALKGQGFALRKQGRTREAESKYQALLKLSPTADSHFLLAQFYQDSQAGDKASFHLEKAVAIGGSRFREAADEMRFRLRSHQFGCFKVR